MKICIIGAGIAGLSCINELAKNNITFDCFEKRNSLGGIWNYSDTEDSVYKNCKQNHPRYSMALNDIPIEHIDKDYLIHTEYLEYLQQFDSPNIHYGCTVQEAKYNSMEQTWFVTVNEEIKRYSHLVVCSGHYVAPYIPGFYKNFTGQLLHSKDYKRPEVFLGKRVLVIGGGSSAVQIASDLVGHAMQVNLSVRSMPYILPRYIDKKILLEFYQNVKHLPECEMINTLKQYGVDQTLFNIRKPEQGLLTGSTVPICDDIFSHVKLNRIKILQAVDTIEDNQISFGNTHLEFDVVILATGYNLNFPFFDFTVNYHDNVDFIINKHQPKLFFIGMVQPVGPVPPLLKTQSKLVSKLIGSNDAILPSSDYWLDKSHRLLLNDYINYIQEHYQL